MIRVCMNFCKEMKISSEWFLHYTKSDNNNKKMKLIWKRQKLKMIQISSIKKIKK